MAGFTKSLDELLNDRAFTIENKMDEESTSPQTSGAEGLGDQTEEDGTVGRGDKVRLKTY